MQSNDQQLAEVSALLTDEQKFPENDASWDEQSWDDDDDQAPEPMDDAELQAFLSSQFSDALGGGDADELSGDRAMAMNYYYGKLRGDECDGRSAVQSLDVADMTEALLAQIMPLFTGSAIGTFETNDPLEADQVRLESEYVNWVIMQKNHGYVTLQSAIKNALLLKNGVIQVCPDYRYEPRTERFKGLMPEQLQAILATSTEEQEVYLVDQTDNEDGTIDATVRTVTSDARLKVESVPLDQFAVDRNHDSPMLDDCDYCARTHVVTRSRLRSMGFDPEQVEDLPASSMGSEIKDEAQARRQYHTNHHRSQDPASDYITIQDHCVRVDYDQDGFAELRRVITAGDAQNEVLYNEEVPFVFFASGSGYIQPGQWAGLSVFDKLKEVQDQKTGFMRQYMDNMNMMNNRRMGVLDRGRVNMDDAMTSFPGSLVRMKQPDAMFPIPVDDIGGSSLQALNYLDQVRTDRAGASLDMQSQQMQVPNDSAHGVERQVSAKEMMAAQITRNLCETLIRGMFLLVHKALKEYFPEAAPVPLLVKQQIQQQQQQAQAQAQDMAAQQAPNMPQPDNSLQMPTSVQPGRWADRDNIIISSGLSQGEKMRSQQAYGAIINFHQQIKSSGDQGVLVSPSAEYEAYLAFAKVAGIPAPERFFVNPMSPQAQQVQAQNAQQMQQQMEAEKQQMEEQLRAQNMVAEAEVEKANSARLRVEMQGRIDMLNMQLESARDEVELAKAASETQFDYDKLASETAVKLLEMEQAGKQELNAQYEQNRETVGND